MRILHIAYQQLRRYGATRVSWAQKLSFGLIKNEHLLQTFSDRDVAAFEAPLGIRELGVGRANRRLLEMVEAMEPELVIAGHCDIISDATLAEIKKRNPYCVIAHCNNDPLFVPANVARIRARAAVVDAVFVSTGRRELKQFDGRAPLPHAESGGRTLDNSRRSDLPIDLLFCSNSDDFTERLAMVARLKSKVSDEMCFKTFGSFGEAPVWGRDYDRALADTKMGLNLNRQEGDYWYSSARMAQLAGNGILQFTHSAPRFDELLPTETAVYFADETELLSKIRAFHGDDAMRRHWAARARAFFHSEMNSRLYAQYIVEASSQCAFSHDYIWVRDIRPDGGSL